MYELDVARYGKWPSSNFGGLSKMACQGVRNRPDKFFKRPEISLVATTSIRQFIPCWSLYLFHVKATLASVPNAAVLITAKLTSDVREVKP
jgi:hypothetical protein